MGAVCTTDSTVPDDQKSESNPLIDSNGAKSGNRGLLRHSTIANMTNEEDLSFYTVGVGIFEIYHSIMSHLGDMSQSEFLKLIEKYNLNYYYFNTVVFVCKGDGTLSDKERSYVERCIKHNKPDVTEKEMKESMEGKDYTNEVLKRYTLLHDELLPKETSKEKKDHFIKNVKLTFLFGCIVSATQDGFVDEEYQRTKKVANDLGITHEEVKKMIKIIEAEIHLANLLKEILV